LRCVAAHRHSIDPMEHAELRNDAIHEARDVRDGEIVCVVIRMLKKDDRKVLAKIEGR